MTHELHLTHFLPCRTQNLTKQRQSHDFSEVKLNYTTRLTDIRLKMFILHVKCNFNENFKDLLSYSSIFDERFFPDTPTATPAGHFSTKTVHGRVFALSILMEIDKLIMVFIWLFVKGKDFSTCWFFPREN